MKFWRIVCFIGLLLAIGVSYAMYVSDNTPTQGGNNSSVTTGQNAPAKRSTFGSN